MILFLLAFIILVLSILGNFVGIFGNNRVLVMSILAILMIMVNFINEVDIVVSPPQIIVKKSTESLGLSGGKGKIKIGFKDPSNQIKQMPYLQQKLVSLAESLQELQSSQDFSQKQKNQAQKSLALLNNFPLKSHEKPLTRQEILLIEEFKKRLSQGEDFIILLDSVDKARMQILSSVMVEAMNEGIKSYKISAMKKVLVSNIYSQKQVYNEQTYKISDKLSNQNYHIIIVYDHPSPSLLNYLYQLYISNDPKYLSIIFLELDYSLISALSISRLIEPLELQLQDNYMEVFSSMVLQNKYGEEQYKKRDTRREQVQLEEMYEYCAKYVTVDYSMLLQLVSMAPVMAINRYCYMLTQRQLTRELQCLKNLTQAFKNNHKDTKDIDLDFNLAKHCWIHENESHKNSFQDFILSRNNKVKLRKQHFWNKKVFPKQLGIRQKDQISAKKTTKSKKQEECKKMEQQCKKDEL